MSALRVTLAQQPLAWQEGAANRARFAELLQPLAGRTDLVVLPETFTTGFSMEVERLGEPPGGETSAWLAQLARALDAVITGSVITRDGARYYNRLLWAAPTGELRHYDKRHLFRMGREHEHFAAGHVAWSVAWRGFNVCPLVCYDLRFPVWSRRRPDLDYDLLLYVANWPAPRADACGNCCGRAPSRTRPTWSASTAWAMTGSECRTPVTAPPSTSGAAPSPMPGMRRRSSRWSCRASRSSHSGRSFPRTSTPTASRSSSSAPRKISPAALYEHPAISETRNFAGAPRWPAFSPVSP